MKLRDIASQIVTERLKYQSLIYNHGLQESLFEESLLEEADATTREEVLQKIRNQEWEKPQNPKSFKSSLSKSKHKEMLTHYSASELAQMKLYKIIGYNIGFALKKKDGSFQEIVAVHNNEPEVKNIGTELMKAAIKEGGCYLDHFDGYLTSFYANLGFEEYDRDKFDPQYDPDSSFRSKYGEADVIYRKHRNCR